MWKEEYEFRTNTMEPQQCLINPMHLEIAAKVFCLQNDIEMVAIYQDGRYLQTVNVND